MMRLITRFRPATTQAVRPGNRTDKLLADPYQLVLLALILLYVVIFARMAFDLHAGMRTHKADLGQIDQAIWNSSRGRLLEQTDNGFVATRLTDHVEPILVLISPIYWMWNDVRAMLLLQVACVALGAWPLYALAKRQFEKLLTPRERSQVWQLEPVQQMARPLALGLAIAYLLAPQLQSAVLTEFHAAPLAVPLILCAFWAVDARRWGQFVVAAALVALVKEEIALLAAGLGLWAMWRCVWEAREGEHGAGRFLVDDAPARRGFLAGAAILAGSLVWFYLATFVIVPANASMVYNTAESTYFQRYGALGNSSFDIFKSFLTQPQVVWQIAAEPARVAYLVGLLVAFAWLPVLAPEIVLLALPVLLANLLSAYPAQYYGEFHYSAPLVPFFAVAAAYGLGRIWRWLARRTDHTSASFQHLPAASTGAMTAMSLVQNSRTAVRPLLTVGLLVWILGWSGINYLQHGRGPLAARDDPTPITAHHQLLERFVAQIPQEAAVTATAAVHPHVNHREYVYQFPLGLDGPAPAEWALLDVTTATDLAPGDIKTKVEAMLAGDWGVVDAADGFLLLHKGATAKSIPDAFYSFAREAAGTAVPAEPLRLQSLDADDWARWRQTSLMAEWQVGQHFDPTQDAPWLDIITPAQATIATLGTASPPALVWYPPERWQPGETIRVTTLPLALPPVVGIRAAGDATSAPMILRRGTDGRLVRLPAALAETPDIGGALRPFVGQLRGAAAVAQLAPGSDMPVSAWLADRTYHPGEPVDLWLQWETPGWPRGLAAFVHLRRDGANVAQQDGAPAFFGPAQVAGAEANHPLINDWRQVTIPADAPIDGAWSIVIGLYDPQTGQRVPLADADGNALGDELLVGTLRLAPRQAPDQSCALNPATCATQPD